MSIDWINAYLSGNALLAVALAVICVVRRWAGDEFESIKPRHLVLLGYGLIVTALLLPPVSVQAELEAVALPAAQIWSGNGLQNSIAADSQWIAASGQQGTALPLNWVATFAIAVMLIGVTFFGWRIAADAMATRRIVRAAHTLHSIGTVRVLVSDEVSIPFSFWYPGRHLIVVPSALLLRPRELAIALQHEAQHHRQGDTQALFFLQLLRALCFWNPAVHGLVKRIVEWQEFACDEAACRNSPLAYCNCLFEVAKHATVDRPLIRSPMVGSRSLLQRRIVAVLSGPRRRLGGASIAAIGSLAIGVLAMISLAIAAPIQDRRITLEIAREMAANVRGSNFPIAVNEQVVEQLNGYLGSPDRRSAMRAALARMKEHKSLIAAHLETHRLPAELLAIPLVESGYRNLEAVRNRRQGAGIWMFIEPTARHYGLEVSRARDERLDVAAETDAALRMLTELHAHFGDWQLALLAYNTGARRVDRGIEVVGERDAWRLIRHGYENDPDYLAKIMAAVLVINSPGLP